MREKTVKQSKQQCDSCLYYSYESTENLEKCMRFSRFVDHVINDLTRDCEYWVSADDG